MGRVQLSVKCVCVIVGGVQRARSVWRLLAAACDYSRQMLRLGEQLPHKYSAKIILFHFGRGSMLK